MVQVGWHQDQGVALPEQDEVNVLTVWLPVTDATEENGCLCVVPGSHRDGLTAHCPGSGPDGGLQIPAKLIARDMTPAPVRRGGALFLHRRTIHASLANRSEDIRWSFDLRYQPVGQPTGRPAFPGFVARSRQSPESELRDWQAWRQLWTRARNWPGRPTQPTTGGAKTRRHAPNVNSVSMDGTPDPKGGADKAAARLVRKAPSFGSPTLRYALQLTRPVFLLGGVLMYALGTAMVARQGISIRLDHWVLGQWMVTSIQLLAQYANEYYDFEADALNTQRTWFSGGSGVQQMGILSRATMRRVVQVAAVVAVAAVIVTLNQAPLAGVIGAVSLIGAWFYSAPPLALMSSGWGELCASLIVAVMTPLTAIAVQAGRLEWSLAVVCIPLAMLHVAMLLTFEFADWEADTAAGKRTLTVRLGRQRGAQLCVALIGMAGVWLAVAALARPEARFVWLVLPLAAGHLLAIGWRTRHGWARLHWLTLSAVSLFAVTGGLWLAGFVLT